VKTTPVIIVEGIMVFAIKEIRDLLDFKIFVDTPADVRLLRRIQRDINERGRTLSSVANQYLSTVRPMHDLYVEPSKVYANIIIPEGGYNKEATDLLVARIRQMVEENH
jgi:uridine kinase